MGGNRSRRHFRHGYIIIADFSVSIYKNKQYWNHSGTVPYLIKIHKRSENTLDNLALKVIREEGGGIGLMIKNTSSIHVSIHVSII